MMNRLSSLQQRISHRLEQLTQNGTRRQRGAYLVTDSKETPIDFSHNDYLRLASHPEVLATAQKAAQHHLGSTGSPMLSGYSQAHAELEAAFAELTGREAALVFTSGYQANLGVITALTSRHDLMLADRQVHASLIDAMRLANVRFQRYRHQDLAHLHSQLQQSSHSINWIVSESVFSITGDQTPIDALQTIAQKSQAYLLLDDAHGFGVLGSLGLGATQAYHLNHQWTPAIITPLGKAAGGLGSVVTGERATIDLIQNQARSYIYSTALPPAIAQATVTSLELMQRETWRHQKLLALIESFHALAQQRNLTLASYDMTPIKSIILGDNNKTLQVQQELRQAGYLTSAIRPPSVPPNHAGIRITLNCEHRYSDLRGLCDQLERIHATTH